MPVWILLVVFVQFLYAIVSIVDKFIVTSKKVSEPFMYAFIVCALSILSVSIFLLGLLPFDFFGMNFPSLSNVYCPSFILILLGVVAQIAFFFSLLTFYMALQRSDASDVVPVSGAVTAIGTLILSVLILGEKLSHNFLIGFVFLVVGTAVVSHFRFNMRTFLYTLISGLSFSLYYVLFKYLFTHNSFDQTFFWTRATMMIVILMIIFIPELRSKIKVGGKETGTKGSLWVIGNNILGGVAGILFLKAIELGNVTIAQALGGLQFVFLMLFSIFLGTRTRVELGENDSGWKVNLQKIVSVAMIVTGFYFLFV